MHSIEIYGFADREICAGCEGQCGATACAPGAKRATSDLVEEFRALAIRSGLEVSVAFYEAIDENIARHEDVRRILAAADLSPAIVMDGKLLFLGGFSPEGLIAEVAKRT
jgi:hypothetical protein